MIEVFTVNRSWELAPWADALYCCDFKCWDHIKGAPGFEGARITPDRAAAVKFKAQFVKLRRFYDHLVFDGPEIGDSGNSGFHTLNIAVKRNDRIVLVGFDMRCDNGLHWHGRHAKGMNNPDAALFTRWRNVLNAEAPHLQAAGVKVYRESDRSLLTSFPVLSIEDALATWL